MNEKTKKFPNLEDFAHNYRKTRIKCPYCNFPQHQKVHCFHNLAGLWRHLKTEHYDYLNPNLKFDEISDLLKIISKAIYLGMI